MNTVPDLEAAERRKPGPGRWNTGLQQWVIGSATTILGERSKASAQCCPAPFPNQFRDESGAGQLHCCGYSGCLREPITG